MMTKFEKWIIGILIVILILVSIMIATGQMKVVVIIGEKVIDQARNIDVKKVAKLLEFVTH